MEAEPPKINFDDGSRIIQAEVQMQQENVVLPEEIPEFFRDVYGIPKVLDFIQKGRHQRVALQFPDKMLPDVPRFMDEINSELGQEGPLVFALGDTSYGACCVDEVNAAHLGADSIVHFGPACLSPTLRLPTCYVFGKESIDVEDCARCINRLFEEQKPEQVILLYEVGFLHRIDELMQQLGQTNNRVVLGKVPDSLERNDDAVVAADNATDSRSKKRGTTCCGGGSYQPPTREGGGACQLDRQTESCCAPAASLGGPCKERSGLPLEEEGNNRRCNLQEGPQDRTQDFLVLAGLEIPKIDEEQLEASTIVYLGSEGPQLSTLLMRCSKSKCFSYDPQRGPNQEFREETGKSNRALMRRFYLVQRAREASIVGLVVGTLGVAGYLSQVRRLRALVEAAGRKAYTFAVGKLNVAKLANFAEVEVFVLVACPNASLLAEADAREYPAPVVTPLELEVALGVREWGFYSADFHDLGGEREEQVENEEGGERETEEKDPDAPIFSLVSGSYRARPGFASVADRDNENVDSIKGKELMEYRSPAGDFLQARQFQGLEQALGETEVRPAVPGQVGIASDYGGV